MLNSRGSCHNDFGFSTHEGSFFGGGSDIPAFYQNNGGAFLSMAINSRIYLAINQTTNNEVKIHYSKTEIVTSAKEIQHPLIKEALYISIGPKTSK